MQLFPLFPTEKNEPLEVPLVHPRKITQHFASESLRNQHVRIGRTKNGASNPTGAAWGRNCGALDVSTIFADRKRACGPQQTR